MGDQDFFKRSVHEEFLEKFMLGTMSTVKPESKALLEQCIVKVFQVQPEMPLLLQAIGAILFKESQKLVENALSFLEIAILKGFIQDL